MDNVRVDNTDKSRYIITVYVEKARVDNFVEAMHEASKTLQREVMRYESNNHWRSDR